MPNYDELLKHHSWSIPKLRPSLPCKGSWALFPDVGHEIRQWNDDCGRCWNPSYHCCCWLACDGLESLQWRVDFPWKVDCDRCCYPTNPTY
eukprot:scaffold19245_cov199-Amphora_coffeaeformis.AAC.9